jgi:hypothetical protein
LQVVVVVDVLLLRWRVLSAVTLHFASKLHIRWFV